METVRVYRYEIYNPASHDFVRQVGYATESAVVASKGIVMYSTWKDVPSSEVGSAGLWAAPDLHRVTAPALA